MVLGFAGAQILSGFPTGFLFGTGYGAGVRFGYEDVYPYLKGNMSNISKILNVPFASSGFKLASGVTDAQGKGSGLSLDVPSDMQQTPIGQVNAPLEGSTDTRGKAMQIVESSRGLSYNPHTGEVRILNYQGADGIVPMNHPLNGVLQDYVKTHGSRTTNGILKYLK